jgi:hypothetical protein
MGVQRDFQMYLYCAGRISSYAGSRTIDERTSWGRHANQSQIRTLVVAG